MNKSFQSFIFHFVVGHFLPNQFSQPNLSSNYLTQKLNKNNKNIHNGDCILAKYIYIYIYIYIFYHQKAKKTCVIREVKTKFFITIVNWYKYQLIVASC